MVRELRKRAADKDDEAQQIAQAIYNVCVDVRGEAGTGPVPLALLGPLTYLGEHAAGGIAKSFGLPSDADTLADIGAYLASGYLSMVAEFNTEHFKTWRHSADRLMRPQEPPR